MGCNIRTRHFDWMEISHPGFYLNPVLLACVISQSYFLRNDRAVIPNLCEESHPALQQGTVLSAYVISPPKSSGRNDWYCL